MKKPLADAFRERFSTAIPENINSNHRMLVVASELDDSSERIVQYLSSVCSLDINVVFFTCFQHNGVELVGRSWLMDPEEVEERSEVRRKASWTGFWFANVGEGPHRDWDDCVRYGFLSAGWGQALQRLAEEAEGWLQGIRLHEGTWLCGIWDCDPGGGMHETSWWGRITYLIFRWHLRRFRLSKRLVSDWRSHTFQSVVVPRIDL